jgi:hypothetical protein
MKQEIWECPYCGRVNSVDLWNCPGCSASRPMQHSPLPRETVPPSVSPSLSPSESYSLSPSAEPTASEEPTREAGVVDSLIRLLRRGR